VKKLLSLMLAVLIILSSIMVLTAVDIFAAGTISYSFSNTNAGYAQGTITLKGDNGKYWLYWADNTKALADYGEITSLTVSGGQGSFAMPKYTAIPADATKLVAFLASEEPAIANRTVAKASAVYSIPQSKLLSADTKDALYTFGAISDPQLDNQSTSRYPYDEVHLQAALETLAERKVDFTVSSGDTVNDQDGPKSYASEYKTYQRLIADSSYDAPIYEALGNHDVGSDWYNSSTNNNAPFIKATGLDSVKSTIDAGKPYFEVTEPKTGDHFIFMALEGGFYTNKNTQFSKAQLDWLEGLLKKYNNDGKNIFIIEHANVAGWGSGDKPAAPYYYDLGLVKTNSDVAHFIKLMETYKDCVIITGHTHLELSAQYNYSDNNGTSAVMMHNSAIGGVRYINSSGDVQRDPAILGLSEGYIVEVYEDFMLFNGTNMYYNETMPQCCYIIPMGTSANDNPVVTTPTEPKPIVPENDNITITLKDETGSGWMKNNAAQREIQLIDNDTNKKYIMKSSDGYKTWTVEVPRSVTDITFKRVRMSDNVDRNIWYAGERGTSVQWCVLDQVEEVTGIGYWNKSATEPPKPVVTEPKETTAPKPVVTEPKETTASNPVVTEPKETTAPKPVVTEPKETTAPKPVVTEPKETTATVAVPTETVTEITTNPDETENTAIITEPASTTSDTTESTPAATATVPGSTPAESKPADIEYLYGDADLNGKVNIKDATQIQKFAAKILDLDEVAMIQADVTGDIKVNIKDATQIQKWVAKIISVFPVQESSLVSVGATYTAKQDLEDYYTYSSYNQYMALKKAYRTSASQSTITSCQNALYSIAGARPEAGGGEITVYFSDAKGWGKVYAHIWGSAGDKASWPGTQMTYVRNNSSGQSIYKISLDFDSYQNIIFHDNSGSTQTVDIALSGENNIGYYVSGGSGKALTVSTYAYSE